MKAHFVKVSALCIAGAVAVPGSAVAQGPTAVQLEVRASADTAKAQQLAQVAPQKAYAYLRRSRAELAAAYRKTKTAGEARAAAMTQHLRTDARSMRDLSHQASGALAVQSARAVQTDIRLEAQLALQAPSAQQSAAADAAADMTSTALQGLRATPARVRAVRRAFARAVAGGLELGRALARRIAAEGSAAADTAQADQDNGLLARIESWTSSVRSQLQGSADGSATVNSPVSGSVTLSALAGDVAGEVHYKSSTFSDGDRGDVVAGWTVVLP
jgi:hypothetical protein